MKPSVIRDYLEMRDGPHEIMGNPQLSAKGRKALREEIENRERKAFEAGWCACANSDNFNHLAEAYEDYKKERVEE
jgi:hypothetical protein